MVTQTSGRCVICGARIAASFDVCAVCECEYGLTGPKVTWPEWAKFLCADHRREQRAEARQLRYEDDTVDTARHIGIALYGEFNDD